MKLEDILLRTGDIVYFDANDDTRYDVVDKSLEGKYATEVYKNIYKIQRQIDYTTIYEAPKQILDKEEKEWLEHFLRPFRNEISWIVKHESCGDNEYIAIKVKGKRCFEFPDFKKDTMYKGMELDKEYTLKELFV